MEQKETKREKFLFPAICFHVLAIVWMGVLTYFCLVSTGIHESSQSELVTIRQDSPLSNLLLFGAALLVCWILGWTRERLLRRMPAWVLPATVCTLTGVLAVSWVLLAETIPESDQMVVLVSAQEFVKGSRSMFERGAYMSAQSQNQGLMIYHIALYLLFGDYSYRAFQVVTAMSVPLLVFSGYRIVGYLSGWNRRAQESYLILMLVCFPVYGYCPFVYGDLPSAVLAMAAVDLFFSCAEKPKVGKGIGLGFLAGVAVQLRRNTLIVIVAFFLALLLQWIRTRERRYLWMEGALLGGVALLWTAVSAFFPVPEDAKAIPPLAYISMGMNEAEIGPGWWDESHYHLFEANDFDAERTKAAAREEIREKWDAYLAEPKVFADFLRRKMVTQWEVPMLECLSTSRLYNYNQTPRPFVKAVYGRGKLAIFMESFMKGYQLLLYGGILLLLLGRMLRRKWEDLLWYTPLIAAFGGFLFSLLWEAKTRYILCYFLLMIPYLAVWIGGCLFGSICGKMEPIFTPRVFFAEWRRTENQ